MDKTKEFIDKAIKVHGDRYDYSKTEYTNAKTKAIFICSLHGEFELTPNKHLNKRGCQLCSTTNQYNKKRDTIESFIEKSKFVHGDTYDYSKTIYVNSTTKVNIHCKKHGEFLQLPSVHKMGMGCQKCGNNYRPTTKEFIEQSIKIHGDTYEYGKIHYVNNTTPVVILCKKHGYFEQTPDCHLRGYGCMKCKNDNLKLIKRKSPSVFIQESIAIHSDTYDYSKVNYIDSDEKVVIVCKNHGEFEQSPRNHLRGSGCIKCSTNYTYTKEEFIEKANIVHGDYDYSDIEFINNKTPIVIKCKVHGRFSQIPSIHLKGHGCSKCARKRITEAQLTNNTFIEKANLIHGKYDYSKVEYKGSNMKVSIICKEHGVFYKTPDNHIHKTNPQGCPNCQLIKQYSCSQVKWLNFMMKYYDLTIHHAENGGEYSIPTTKYKADGFCKETNTIYEFHGDFWHGNPDIYDTDQLNPISKKTFGALYQKTIEKEQHLKQLGYNVVVMWENKWNKIIRSIRLLQKLYHSSSNHKP